MKIDNDNLGGFLLPKIYFNPKRGWIAYYCRRIGRWLFLLGYDELHPYEDLLKAMTEMKVIKK